MKNYSFCENAKKKKMQKKKKNGGGVGGQDRCERKIEELKFS